jgi:glycosyltransferase involved in cell wall biosynthesis
MTPINVLHLMNNLSDSSISRIAYNLVRHLRDDIQWHIGGLDGLGDMLDNFQGYGARTVDFAAGNAGQQSAADLVRDYLSSHRIRIVHTHTPRTLLVAALAARRTPQVRHLATKHILNAVGDRKWGAFYTITDRLSLYLPDHLVAVSRHIRDVMMATPGIRADRVTLIQNAIDTESLCAPWLRESCRAEFGLQPEAQVIGNVGRLDKVKRLDLLIRGFAPVLERYPDARLMLVGDGALKQELEALARSLQVSDAIIWTGFRRDIPRLLAAMDIYIQTSVNEGLSLSILEAMAAEKPVVITDVGGAREVVADGSTGIIIAPGSAPAIAQSLNNLLGNPEMRSELARMARVQVCREFGLGKMMQSYHETYQALAR